MKQTIALLALISLMIAGCTQSGRKAVPPESPPAHPESAAATPAPSGEAPRTIALLKLQDIMGVTLGYQSGAFLYAERYSDYIRAVTEALPGAEVATGPAAGSARFSVTLHLSLTEAVIMSPGTADEVFVTAPGWPERIRSAALTRALEALNSLQVRFDRSAVLARVQTDLGPEWKPKGAEVPSAAWVNESSGLFISVHAWESVITDGKGHWAVGDRYSWAGFFDPVPVAVRGPGRTYQTIRFRPGHEGTGGGFFGTHPVQIDVVGRTGGLSLACSSGVSSQDAAVRAAAQRVVDAECPKLLERFTADLGDPIIPLVEESAGNKPVLERSGQGYRLTLPRGAYSPWLGQRGPNQWQISAGGRQWLLDLEKGSMREAPLAWPDGLHLTLPDGNLLGVRGNHFVLQDLARGTETRLAETGGQVTALAAVSGTVAAYSLHGPGQYDQAGPLWQLDWRTGERRQIAEQGWPVGVLADGRAIAQQGHAVGPVMAWRPGSAGAVEVLSPQGVQPYYATVSPDGKRLAYFQAVSANPYPRVDTVAVWDAETAKTSVKPLPNSGYVRDIAWDGAGRLTFMADGTAGPVLLQVTPTGDLITLSPPGQIGYFAGRDGCALLFGRDNDVVRHWPDGCPAPQGQGRNPSPLFTRGQALGWGGRTLLGFPLGRGMEILDTRTGKRYWAPNLAVPELPLPPWAEFGPLLPESGFVALQVQHAGQVIYQIAAVTPK